MYLRLKQEIEGFMFLILRVSILGEVFRIALFKVPHKICQLRLNLQDGTCFESFLSLTV